MTPGSPITKAAPYALAAERVCVVGLDCVPPELVFGQWREELPTFDRLCCRGVFGPMRSSIPPITVPAWACMASGVDPGGLGLYGFRNRASHAYGDLFIANSRSVKAPRLWDLLGEDGLRSFVLGVPLTYPPELINGLMVSCFLTPDKNADFTHPRWLKSKIDRWAGGEYMLDVDDFRTEDKQRLLADIHRMTRARFTLARRLLMEDWDFFMMVEMGPDRLHHGFWRFHDPTHRRHEPGNQYENVIFDYYRYLDRELGRIWEGLPDGTLLLVVSDHGVKRLVGGIAVNQWLINQGLLKLKDPDHSGAVSPQDIDWSRTRVWSEGGYYARIFFNVEGREPQGVIAAEDYGRFRAEMVQALAGITDEQGYPLDNRVLAPEDIYRRVVGTAPDLIVMFGDLDWRSLGTVGHDSIWQFENDTGPDDANHAMDGICLAALKGRALDNPGRADTSIYDIAPTVLSALGRPVPAYMRGRPIAG